MNKEFTTIYIARHGQTEWNVKGLMQGHRDTHLTEKGKQEAEGLKNQFKSIHLDVIFSSDLIRARETARPIASDKNLVLQTTKILREQSFGQYEGLDKESFFKLFDKWNDMNDEERQKYKLSDDMESNEEALNRLTAFLKETATTYKGKSVLIVSHGGLMRYLLIKLGIADYNYFFENSGYIELESDGKEFVVKKLKGLIKPVSE